MPRERTEPKIVFKGAGTRPGSIKLIVSDNVRAQHLDNLEVERAAEIVADPDFQGAWATRHEPIDGTEATAAFISAFYSKVAK